MDIRWQRLLSLILFVFWVHPGLACKILLCLPTEKMTNQIINYFEVFDINWPILYCYRRILFISFFMGHFICFSCGYISLSYKDLYMMSMSFFSLSTFFLNLIENIFLFNNVVKIFV